MHDLIMLKCAKLQCAFCIFFKMIMPTTSIHLNILFTKYVHRTFDLSIFSVRPKGCFTIFIWCSNEQLHYSISLETIFKKATPETDRKKPLQQRTFTQRCKTFYLINQVKSSAKKRFVEYLLCIVFREAKYTLWVCSSTSIM